MGEKESAMFRIAKIYFKRHLKFDIVAAIVVFLIAIPLCLGVALASGAPLFSGIISGIIGGIVVGALSGSQISVSGPDAAMAAVVFSAIAALGDFNVFLLALVMAGMFQILIGIFRAGFVVEYVPGNVVQGLLCAIGILLIVKQIPLAFTFSNDLKSLQHVLVQTTEGITLTPFYSLSYHINSGAALYTLISLAILVFFDKTSNERLKAFPATIVVLVSCIALNELFIATNSIFAQADSHLVSIPQHEEFSQFFEQFKFPSWASWRDPNVYFYAVVLAIVASLSSLLNIKAAEKLDRKNRVCSKDRELIAQGVGNVFSGFVGGLPITSVIIRTSVNIQAGAVSKGSAILHGLFILLAVLWLPQLLNMIPISCLAAILMYTGFKLTKPEVYAKIYAQGATQFIPFIATVISIVLFNLLGGILIGLTISFFLSSNRTVKHASI